MKTTLEATPWAIVESDAHYRRRTLLEHLRRWSAQSHLRSRVDTPTRTIAALDTLSKPIRTGIVAASTDSTDRDRAEAAADDLWDGVATVWSVVASVETKDVPGLEHLLAELAECGRWLAAYPVVVARHDQALSRLFND